MVSNSSESKGNMEGSVKKWLTVPSPHKAGTQFQKSTITPVLPGLVEGVVSEDKAKVNEMERRN